MPTTPAALAGSTASCVWLEVHVDEDGRMVVRDAVEGHESSVYETVMEDPEKWAEFVREGVLEVLKLAGNLD